MNSKLYKKNLKEIYRIIGMYKINDDLLIEDKLKYAYACMFNKVLKLKKDQIGLGNDMGVYCLKKLTRYDFNAAIDKQGFETINIILYHLKHCSHYKIKKMI